MGDSRDRLERDAEALVMEFAPPALRRELADAILLLLDRQAHLTAERRDEWWRGVVHPRASRACRNASRYRSTFECSECGAITPELDEDGIPVMVVGDAVEEISFCPNCGRKVVE